MAYLGNDTKTIISKARKAYTYTAIAGQTIFTGADDNSEVLSCTPNTFTNVFLNGVRLIKNDDFTVETNQFTLTAGAAAGDEITFVADVEYSVYNTYTRSETDTQITNAVNGLLDAAPEQLNTLNELSAALNDDADFAGTVTSSLALKADKSNVLEKNNTVVYAPTSAYHPATKAYVDALASSGGGNVAITKGFTFSGDGSTTTFDCGTADSYILGAIDIYYNGFQLDSSDYAAGDGQTFALNFTPEVGAIIKLVAYGGADVYNKTQTDTLLAAKADLGGADFTDSISVGTSDGANNLIKVPASTVGFSSFPLSGAAFGTAYSNTYIRHDGTMIFTDGINESLSIENTNVGINTNNPAGKLHVNVGSSRSAGGNWDSNSVIINNDNSGSNAAGAIAFSYDDSRGGLIETLAPGVAWKTFNVMSKDIVLGTNGNNPGLNISVYGEVTTPRQPSFSAYKTNNNSYTHLTPIDWTTTHNTSGSFNGQRFTAPVDGTYQFNYGGVTHAVTNYFYIGFALNGSNTVQPAYGSWRHLPNTEGEYSFLHTSMTVYLYAGDYIEAWSGYNGGSPYLESVRSGFSGYLIG